LNGLFLRFLIGHLFVASVITVVIVSCLNKIIDVSEAVPILGGFLWLARDKCALEL